MLSRCGHFLLVTLVRLRYHEPCMNCGCICFEVVFSVKQPDSAAMFPGRFPNVPDTMWNFGWNPQPMGLQGQFCGGDMMNQQSQAQTQAQLAALREQNSILNQQLASQAQSYIQHLQQLIPFHQPTSQPHTTSTPPIPQPTPPASEPPAPVAPPSTQTGSSASFNPEEMMEQMKHTVESSIQAFVDKTQDRNTSHFPSPSHPPIPVSPHTISHPHPPDEVPKSHQRSHRRSRSQHACTHHAIIYPTPATSRCHFPLENVKATHGRYFMGRYFILLSKSSLKARSDQPTGPIIGTFNVATCQPSGHSTLAGKYRTVTRPSQIGRKESYSMPSRRKEKDNKIS